jgi:enamine deaminase RidA (YjgF/YER057c/UK114 family)
MTAPKALEILNPPALGPPHGFSHAVLVEEGARLLLVAGQTSRDREGRIRSPGDIVGQFDHALANVAAALAHAGTTVSQIARMRIYVTDVVRYRASLGPLGEVWRRHFGGYYPAITLVEVKGLFDESALVEIEVEAVLPS